MTEGTCPIPTSMPIYPASISFSLRCLNPSLLLLLLLSSLCSADARALTFFSTSCSVAVGAWNSGLMVATSSARAWRRFLLLLLPQQPPPCLWREHLRWWHVEALTRPQVAQSRDCRPQQPRVQSGAGRQPCICRCGARAVRLRVSVRRARCADDHPRREGRLLARAVRDR